MIKLTGVILTLGSTSLAGFLWSVCFIKRCKLLKSWIAVLELLKTAICYQAEVLPEIFKKIALTTDEPHLIEAFKRLTRRFEYGLEDGITHLWNEFLNFPEFQLMQPEDLKALRELGIFLGSTDRIDQVAKISLCQEQLRYNLNSAEIYCQKRVGLYRYLGFAFGAILVLWFI